ncbi:MAG TPA: CHASE3 domain-containing protein [Polyangiaceae bacterium]
MAEPRLCAKEREIMWTFGRRIAAGFAVSFALLAVVGVVAYRSIETLTRTSYLVTHTHTVIDRTAGVLSELKDAETGQRGFVITGDDAYLDPYRTGTTHVPALLAELKQLTADNPHQGTRIAQLEPLVAAKFAELARTIEIRRTQGFEATQRIVADNEGKRLMDESRRILADMDREEHDLLRQRADEVEAAAGAARTTIFGGTLICLLFIVVAGTVLTRSLTSQVGAAVQHVQQSAAELQSVANQQASGAKESATSMTEITTTITELLATSRQIAESAQRVASVAEQTAGAARTGEGTVQRASDSIAAIRRQVDLVVSHMLELGRKSQQIGSVLEIVSELAEQTNILAINATIEAAGAGEAGRRFGVVAAEIRSLADRVGASTKEIRGLIEDVRGAVNTTVMATETGSKAVDSGNRLFGEVTTSFKQVAELVLTTTDAAREIQLSTKQQSTAVEQVNVAISNSAQAARETESSSGQTLQTASQLAGLSRDLLRLVQAQSAA